MNKIILLILGLCFFQHLYSQCDYSFLPGEVVMDDSSGRIYMFRKIENNMVTFRVNSINPQVHLNMPYTKPCKEINLIKPFFEEGDFIHSWEGEKYAVHAYQPRWDTDDPQLITIINEKENRITHETIRLKWQWIERIEKNNDYQERLKKFEKEQLIFWADENGDTLNGWVKTIYSSKKSLKIERFTLDNKIIVEDIDVEKIVPKYKRTLNTLRDTVEMIRTNWRSEKFLVLDLEKKRKYTKENNIKSLELKDEYKLHRHDDFHLWSDERKHNSGYNYSFDAKISYVDTNGKIIAFAHGYKGRTSTWDRHMNGKWEYKNKHIFVENGYHVLKFKIEKLNKNQLWLVLLHYENKLVK